MAQNGTKPHYFAKAKQGPDSDYWQSIGVAWNIKDGMISVKLQTIPTDWKGDFVLIPPKE